MILSFIVNYWCIHHDHKCKVEDIETRVVELLIIVYYCKNVINIILKGIYINFMAIIFTNWLLGVGWREGVLGLTRGFSYHVGW